MDKYQKKTYMQACNLLKLHEYLDVLKKDIFYQNVIQKVNEAVIKIEKLILIQYTTKIHTSLKHKSRLKLELICLRIAMRLKSYASFNLYAPFLDLKGFGKNQLYKYSGINLLNKSKDLLAFIQKYKKKVEATELDMGLVKSLKDAVSDFKRHLEKPQKHIESVKKATCVIRNELKAYCLLLNRVIKPYMLSQYEQTQPKLYYKFLFSLIKEKTPKRKRALQGRITDREGNPLHRVRVWVDDKKPLVKRGTKGNFFFKNMTNGSHKLKFSCQGFKTLVKEVMIYPSRTTKLIVVMQREKAVELNEPIASLGS